MSSSKLNIQIDFRRMATRYMPTEAWCCDGCGRRDPTKPKDTEKNPKQTGFAELLNVHLIPHQI